MSGSLNIMSPSEFAAGGPQATAAPGIGAGVGQLANVIAQGPRMHAIAGHMAAQTDLLNAQTTGVGADTALKQGKLARGKEAQDILSDPNSIRDPAKMSRLYAIGAADPELAAHITGMVAGVASSLAFNKQITQREADAMSGSSGAVAYQNTPTGVEAGLANTRTTTGMTIAGNQRLQDTQKVWVIPPGAPPGTRPYLTTQADATANHLQPVTPEQTSEADKPIWVLPPNAPPGTRPTLMPTSEAAAKGMQPVTPGQVQAGDKPMTVNTGSGPQIATEATAPGNRPVMTTPEAQGALYGNLLFPQQGQPGQGGPSPLATTLGGGGQPFSLPNQQQPPAPAPAPAPGSPVVPGAAATPAPTPAPQTDDEKLAQAQFSGRLATAMSSNVPLSKLGPKDSAAFEQYISDAGPRNYPLPTGLFPGEKRELGPLAKAEINRRAQAYFASREPGVAGQVGASVDRAIRELQVEGRLKPPGVLPGNPMEHVPFIGDEKHIVELEPEKPQPASRGGGGGGPGKSAAPVPQAQGEGASPRPTKTQVDPKSGQRWGLVNNEWVKLN